MTDEKTVSDPNWSTKRVEIYLGDLFIIAPDVVISGGWAWHFLSPPGHVETKFSHDHRDVSMFVAPSRMTSVSLDIGELGFTECVLKTDKSHGKVPKDEFHRYEKFVDNVGLKMVFEVTVREVPFRTIGEYQVLDPKELLKLYEKSTADWGAVVAARKLIAEGIDPQGRPELMGLPTLRGSKEI
jgi:hypothetical protein